MFPKCRSQIFFYFSGWSGLNLRNTSLILAFKGRVCNNPMVANMDDMFAKDIELFTPI